MRKPFQPGTALEHLLGCWDPRHLLLPDAACTLNKTLAKKQHDLASGRRPGQKFTPW